ncbi:MAG: hypothetical protein IKU02_09505 [Bacteroidaceae bacterium]|nr:hypothetical protein [Bacteroidaceae bacterium]
MKKIILFALLTTSFLSTNAQDILVRKSGEAENVKVLEISSTEVKYKKSTNEDGPTFVEKCSNLYSIKYNNGDIQTFGDNPKLSRFNSFCSKYGGGKKYTHEIDLYIQNGWGVGYQFRRTLLPIAALNILDVSYMSGFCNPREQGLFNLRPLGLRLYTPAHEFRIYAGLNLGFSFIYANEKGFHPNNQLAWKWKYRQSCFGLDFKAGIQFHKNIAIGYNLNFIKNKNIKGMGHWGNISVLF